MHYVWALVLCVLHERTLLLESFSFFNLWDWIFWSSWSLLLSCVLSNDRLSVICCRTPEYTNHSRYLKCTLCDINILIPQQWSGQKRREKRALYVCRTLSLSWCTSLNGAVILLLNDPLWVSTNCPVSQDRLPIKKQQLENEQSEWGSPSETLMWRVGKRNDLQFSSPT